MGDLCETFQVGNLAGGLATTSVWIALVFSSVPPCSRRVGAGHEGGFNAEAAQGHVQLGDGAAVQPARRRDDVVACWQSATKVMNSAGHAEAVGHDTDAAFEGEAMRSSRAAAVGFFDRREYVAVLLQGEEVRGVVSVFEDEGGSLVEWGPRGHRARRQGTAARAVRGSGSRKACSAIGFAPGVSARLLCGESIVARLYTRATGGVHQVRVPMCVCLRIMTGCFR